MCHEGAEVHAPFGHVLELPLLFVNPFTVCAAHQKRRQNTRQVSGITLSSSGQWHVLNWVSFQRAARQRLERAEIPPMTDSASLCHVMAVLFACRKNGAPAPWAPPLADVSGVLLCVSTLKKGAQTQVT